MTIKQKMDTARMKAARILVKALFTAATEDDAADHSSEKSRPRKQTSKSRSSTCSTQNRRSATMSLTAPRRAAEASEHIENPCSIQTSRAASCKWLKTNRCPLPRSGERASSAFTVPTPVWRFHTGKLSVARRRLCCSNSEALR